MARSPQQILRDALTERTAANPRYSLRAFARDLRLSPQQLSNVMNGRKGISAQTAQQLADRLGLSERQKESFCLGVQATYSRNRSIKREAQLRLDQLAATVDSSTQLDMDAFLIVSGWHHLALTELLRTKISRGKGKAWLAKKLGLPVREISIALQRLERVGLIARESPTRESWRALQDTVFTPDGVPSEALRQLHRHVIEKALAAIPTQTVEERHLSTSTLSVPKKNLSKAKKLIQEFRTRFAAEIEDPEEAENVYVLSMQLFRLTEDEISQEKSK